MNYSAKDFQEMRMMKKASEDKKKAEFKRNFIFSGLILFIIFISGMFMTTYADANNIKVVEYQIQAGDTLWEIAEEYNKSNKDIREYIYELKKINALNSGLINPGQTIKVPIYSNYWFKGWGE